MKHLPNIIIEVVPHSHQRYDTCGDYQKEGKDWYFTISKTTSDAEFLVLMHELYEWYSTQKEGIKEEDITKFDKTFEKKRKKGNTDEPGNDPKAPYRKEHMFATVIERLIARELKIDWDKYDDDMVSLLDTYDSKKVR